MFLVTRTSLLLLSVLIAVAAWSCRPAKKSTISSEDTSIQFSAKYEASKEQVLFSWDLPDGAAQSDVSSVSITAGAPVEGTIKDAQANTAVKIGPAHFDVAFNISSANSPKTLRCSVSGLSLAKSKSGDCVGVQESAGKAPREFIEACKLANPETLKEDRGGPAEQDGRSCVCGINGRVLDAKNYFDGAGKFKVLAFKKDCGLNVGPTNTRTPTSQVPAEFGEACKAAGGSYDRGSTVCVCEETGRALLLRDYTNEHGLIDLEGLKRHCRGTAASSAPRPTPTPTKS